MVVLVSKDTESNQELLRRNQSDLDGSFSLQSVIPGSYTIIALENAWNLDWAKPAVLARTLFPVQRLRPQCLPPTSLQQFLHQQDIVNSSLLLRIHQSAGFVWWIGHGANIRYQGSDVALG